MAAIDCSRVLYLRTHLESEKLELLSCSGCGIMQICDFFDFRHGSRFLCCQLAFATGGSSEGCLAAFALDILCLFCL